MLSLYFIKVIFSKVYSTYVTQASSATWQWPGEKCDKKYDTDQNKTSNGGYLDSSLFHSLVHLKFLTLSFDLNRW